MRAAGLVSAVFAAALVLLAVAPAGAEPYLMVRQGAKCSACHTNETGGGKRTPFAHIHGKDILHDLDLLPIPPGMKAFNGELNSYASIGSDLRVRNTTVFTDRGPSVPQNQAFRRSVTSNDTKVNEFLMYGQIDLWPDIVTLYLDEDFTTGANTREAFGLIHGVLPWETYLKAGRFFPPYGLRVQDDQAFIRARTGYTFQNPDEGGEIGIQPGPFFVATSVTNGVNSPAGPKDVQASGNGYTVFEDVPVVRTVTTGASFARQSNKRWVGGFYGGANLWKFTYLGEFDFINDRKMGSAGRNDQYAAYAELDLLLFDWLNLRGTFDFVKVAGDRDQTRYTIGAEPFINKVIQPRIQYRINNGIPSEPTQNQDELWLELHLFL
jgi:hypothetical protein